MLENENKEYDETFTVNNITTRKFKREWTCNDPTPLTLLNYPPNLLHFGNLCRDPQHSSPRVWITYLYHTHSKSFTL